MKNASFPANWYKYLLMAVTAVLLTVTGIVYHQDIFLLLPHYISLVVGFLQTSANRYSLLLGSFNSLLYTAAYLYLGLYASAAQAFFFSFLFQLLSFILWNRRKHGSSTRFRKLSGLLRAVIGAGFLCAFLLVCFLLDQAGSSYQVLDSLSSLLGALVSVLTLFAFIEYTWLMLPSGLITIFLYAATMAQQPGQITYLIFSVYSLICVTQGFFSVRKLYAQQQKEEKERERQHHSA